MVLKWSIERLAAGTGRDWKQELTHQLETKVFDQKIELPRLNALAGDLKLQDHLMENTTSTEEDIELQWNCPHCQSLLELDETGELIVLEGPPLEEGERAGVNGIKVLESDPGWKQRDQLFNLGDKKRAAPQSSIWFHSFARCRA